ncbi:hypothetical protein EJ02DRAFT_236573 [Clathrospora elynae]|uniref:Secreted protein n=1 Tax=Clathrospora elynae TaxID=706981 RepID=A0A6A5SKS4_9PLEO|nr:hypothetical protein EJ02DRAFT_236573 [Clathrospora elynae]
MNLKFLCIYTLLAQLFILAPGLQRFTKLRCSKGLTSSGAPKYYQAPGLQRIARHYYERGAYLQHTPQLSSVVKQLNCCLQRLLPRRCVFVV